MDLQRLVSSLKPRDAEVRALAEREADPAFAAEFEPICRGPWFAALALAAVGVLSLSGMAWRLVRAVFGAGARVE
jgi:hypothetical protein